VAGTSGLPGIAEEGVWDILRSIPDPEIPTINLVDLGVIGWIEVGEKIRVAMLPTFVGCPALDMMQREIRAGLEPYGEVEVTVSFAEAWTSARITAAGREMLKEAGLAPPPEGDGFAADGLDELPMHSPPAACPRCGGFDTRQESLFGPTPCRALHYCSSCREPFERFKAL
jgi:ring-1,2-phenylacetyl-CoA epoxidase subunit PaaD